MTFNSLAFILFAAIFFLILPLVYSRHTAKYLFIILASFAFYAFWDFRFIFLFIVIGLVDYSIGLAIQRYPEKGKAWLAISISNTLIWLILFRYSSFFASNIDVLLRPFHLNFRFQYSVPGFMLIGPVGLSFYAFMSMSYVVETYRGRIEATRNPLQYLAYLSFFPHLMCGPIIRPKDLLSQLGEKRTSTESQRWDALILISHGYFKKMVLADNFAPIVNHAFANPQLNSSGIYWWMIMILFAAQIYCDFSGYSDIARGLFKAMGYDIPLNFNHPYTSSSLREFWQRWHISLSTWFRDYVYIPLGGSRLSPFKTYRNLWVTFLLSGFWHGAAWHFVIWGGLHAFYLSFEKWTKWPERLEKLPLGKIVCLVLTLFQVIVAWVFFRAVDFSQGLRILNMMFIDFSWSAGINKFTFFLLLVLILREVFIFVSSQKKLQLAFLEWKPVQEFTIALLLMIAVYWRGPGNVFIYFQF